MKSILLSLVLLAASGASFAQTKTDMFGLRPGMFYDDAVRAIADRRYNCRIVKDSKIHECLIDTAFVTVYFAEELPDAPIFRMNVELRNSAGGLATARSIATQYGLTVGSEKGPWQWAIGKSTLTLEGQYLMFFDREIELRNRNADSRPAPKF